MNISYPDFLKQHSLGDSRLNWVRWKVDCCGMEPHEALKASLDPQWGWEPIHASRMKG